MDTWEQIKKTMSELADLAKEKTGELADEASVRIRLGNACREEDEAFENLGRLMYARLRGGESNTGEVDDVLSRIDTLEDKIAGLTDDLAALREERDRRRAERKAKQAEEAAAEAAKTAEASETTEVTAVGPQE